MVRVTLRATLLLMGIMLGQDVVRAQSVPSDLRLRLEKQSNRLELLVDGSVSSGALFVYRQQQIAATVPSAEVVLATNVVPTNSLRFSLAETVTSGAQGFFTAAHWPETKAEALGDSDFIPDVPAARMVLITTGVPRTLPLAKALTVSFLITDADGAALDINGPVALVVLRSDNGMKHPDAIVSPGVGQMEGGQLRARLVVQSVTDITGYTLGLGPSLVPTSGRGPAFVSGPVLASPLDGFLETSCNLGPTPDAPLTPGLVRQLRAELRNSYRDPDTSWLMPLSVRTLSLPVSGTFGEWRGGANDHVHIGLDLSATPATPINASRGGLVTMRGTMNCIGAYLIVDHGDGYLSAYLHLKEDEILVTKGQIVVRGQPLATQLYARSFPCGSSAAWGPHLHFEVRKGDPDGWYIGKPYAKTDSKTVAQDPLQTKGMFPVNPGIRAPKVEEIGLTHDHPGRTPFAKRSAPPANGSGKPVYLVARIVDVHGAQIPQNQDPRFALRAVGFRLPGPTLPKWIWPSNETAIGTLLPARNLGPQEPAERGFGSYTTSGRADWFRYYWRWDTEPYRSAARGPREVLLEGRAYDERAASWSFSFGPRIVLISPALVGSGFEVRIEASLGATGIPGLSQPDQYKFEVVNAEDGTILKNVTWRSPLQGSVDSGVTPRFVQHLAEATHSFVLPPGADPADFLLRVSSVFLPDLAHEIRLNGCPSGNVSPGPNMVLIPPGTFRMGNDKGGYASPSHTVTVSAFYMDQFELTTKLWIEVTEWAQAHGYGSMGSLDPDLNLEESRLFSKGASHPIAGVGFYAAVAWCNARSEKEGRIPAYYYDEKQRVIFRSGLNPDRPLSVRWCSGYRLPTEAEWEYAARGGLAGRHFPWGEGISHAQANYDITDPEDDAGYHPVFATGDRPYTAPVGSFSPNAFGLYDMAGNVSEFCWDWDGLYSGNPQVNPTGADTGFYRIVRGGGWSDQSYYCEVSFRDFHIGRMVTSSHGFRTVLAAN